MAALFALDERISSFGYIGGAFIFSGLIITEILGNRNSKVKNGS